MFQCVCEEMGKRSVTVVHETIGKGRLCRECLAARCVHMYVHLTYISCAECHTN